MDRNERLATRVGAMKLVHPVICGSGEAVATEAGIRAALRAGAAGVIAKSVNEQPAAARQLDRADYVGLDAAGAPVPWGAEAVSLFNRSGLSQRDTADWFASLAELDTEAAATNRFVAASLVLGGSDGAVAIATAAHDAGLRVFELNVGAPHASKATPGAIANEADPTALGALAVRDLRFADIIGRTADTLASYADVPDRPGHGLGFVPP